MSRLCFDYGHGGEDSGASYNGRNEFDDVLSPGEKSKSLAESIQAALVDLGFTYRGVKEANFHVLRETKAQQC